MGSHKEHKKDKKKDKDKRKDEETEEEKRERRLQKKAAKAAKAVTSLGGYTNDTNPWNDPNLLQRFDWGKKNERERSKGIVQDTSAAAQKRKQLEIAEEVEKVKRAREEREREREEREEERRLLDKEREQMAYHEHEQREDQFQLEQSHLRANIRIKEGRSKPIDIVAGSLALLKEGFTAEDALDWQLQDPLELFDTLAHRELKELTTDINTHAALDLTNSSFWSAMEKLAHEAIRREEETMAAARAEAARAVGRGGGGAEAGGSTGGTVHKAVSAEIEEMLNSKSEDELADLRGMVEDRLQDDEALDADYWESLLRKLGVVEARVTVAKVAKAVRQRKHDLIRGESSAAAVPAAAVLREGGVEDSEDDDELNQLVEEGEEAAGMSGRYSPTLLTAEEAGGDGGALEAAGGASASGRFSPVLLTAREVNVADAVDPEDDLEDLRTSRAKIESRTKRPEDAAGDLDGENQITQEAKKGMGQGEARFSFEVALEKKASWWHDKYRPRKPKYFNRVHTGYEWNKYNQTHYDHDNPPPKMVQGYKFNVFYPDLIDRTKPPTYQLVPDPDGAKDTCILRFRGGPPYEDIAFKIVNREWETSHKRGFKCRFERGILQLFINFKRQRYRR